MPLAKALDPTHCLYIPKLGLTSDTQVLSGISRQYNIEYYSSKTYPFSAQIKPNSKLKLPTSSGGSDLPTIASCISVFSLSAKN